MRGLTDGVLLLLMLTNLIQLGSSRLRVCIHMLAIQGIALSFLPFFLDPQYITGRAILLALPPLILRGVVFPWLLLRVLERVGVRREVEPYLGFSFSLLFGVLATAISLHSASRLALPGGSHSPYLAPAAFLAFLVGLFLIVTRRKALSQVLGYLVMENGIYTFGMAVAAHHPWMIELGILLDILVAVFIMGIAMFHINREFDHLDVDRLTSLRDATLQAETKPSLQEGMR